MAVIYNVGPNEFVEECKDYVWVVAWFEDLGCYEGQGQAICFDGQKYFLQSLSCASYFTAEQNFLSGEEVDIEWIIGDEIPLGLDLKPEVIEKVRQLCVLRQPNQSTS